MFYEENPEKANKYVRIDISKELKLYEKVVDKWIYIGCVHIYLYGIFILRNIGLNLVNILIYMSICYD